MTILVTGVTGLVGSGLLRRFVDAGLDCVRWCDRARKLLLE
jgi:nucleoside-diphosphate-sugar epimerase